MATYKHLTDIDREILAGAIAVMTVNLLSRDTQGAADAVLGSVDRIIGLHVEPKSDTL